MALIADLMFATGLVLVLIQAISLALVLIVVALHPRNANVTVKFDYLIIGTALILVSYFIQ